MRFVSVNLRGLSVLTQQGVEPPGTEVVMLVRYLVINDRPATRNYTMYALLTNDGMIHAEEMGGQNGPPPLYTFATKPGIAVPPDLPAAISKFLDED